MPAPDLLERAIQAARAGRRAEARGLLLELVEAEPRNEAAWIWLSGLVDELEDKIIACENVLTLNPSNERMRVYLNQLLEQQAQLRGGPEPRPVAGVQPTLPGAGHPDPWQLAKRHEAEGRLGDALEVLSTLAGRTSDPREFDRIYREISRLESLQAEGIAHVAPASHIARMTFGWPLLYFFLALVQMGLNPLARGAWYLWLGLPIVAVGGFLLALSEIHSRHAVWMAVFSDETGEGSSMARTSAAIGGWLLVLMPHVLLLADAIARLQSFRPPSFPG
jgi:hypothetical protein